MPVMTHMELSLPESLKSFVEERVENGGYKTASEYMQNLISEDQKIFAERRLEAMLLSGLDSPSRLWKKGDSEEINRVVRERLTAKQAK